jgi:ABC-type amino acid transport substrate-binding protein
LQSIEVVTKAARTDINNVENLYGKTVGVQIGTTHEEWAAENLEKPGKASVRRYDKVYSPHGRGLEEGRRRRHNSRQVNSHGVDQEVSR